MTIESLSEQSQENIADLLKRIEKKECCAFIGAGLSRCANYPLWSDLLDKLKGEAERIQDSKIDDGRLDYYDRAEKYRKILGIENYHTIINNEFNPNNNKQPWLSVHLYLVGMPFVSYISTNYDCMIENAYSEKGLQPIYNYYPLLPITRLRDRQIYHIHGVIDHTKLKETQSSIILTRSDFDEAYKSGSNLVKLITCIYTELTMFFVGFNVKDPFMMKILKRSIAEYEQTKTIAFEHGISPLKDTKHYALLSYHQRSARDIDNYSGESITREIDWEATNLEDEELRSLGVYTIRYISDDFNHTQSINIIREMHSIVTRVERPSMIQDLTFRGA